MNWDQNPEIRLNQIRSELEREFTKPIPEDEIRKWMPGIPVRRSALIQLTKLNGTEFVLNAELIETMESTPDTILSLVTGRKYIVRESVDEVRKRCLDYKRGAAHRE